MTKTQTIFCLIASLTLLSLAQAKLGQQPLVPTNEVSEQSEPITMVDAPLAIGLCDYLNTEASFVCSEETKYPGCVCYRNETCSNAVIDECACDDSNVLNYTFNANCSTPQESADFDGALEDIEEEAQEENQPQPSGGIFGPALAFGYCDYLNSEEDFLCSEETKFPGCVCYRNDTCSNATVDECACQDANVLNYTFNANCSAPQQDVGVPQEQPETAVGSPLAFGNCQDYVSDPTCPTPDANAIPNSCFLFKNRTSDSGYADGSNNCACEDSNLESYTVGFTCDNGELDA